MIIAVASGKGGTGKTTVAASLAWVWSKIGPVTAVDMDVEAPNLGLFLKPEVVDRALAEITVPLVDEDKCTRCRACAEVCQFMAISVMGDFILTFPDMCHGCGGCLEVCPEGAVTAGSRELGEISWGHAEKIKFMMGRLRIGEAMSPPLMRQIKARLTDFALGDVIIDAPPGVSCPAVNAVMDADAVVLASEPTPFGLHDLTLAVEAFRPLGMPLGVIINRAGLGDDRINRFCQAEGLPVLAEIPFSRDLAGAYSRGEILARVDRGIEDLFVGLVDRVKDLAQGSKEAVNA